MDRLWKTFLQTGQTPVTHFLQRRERGFVAVNGEAHSMQVLTLLNGGGTDQVFFLLLTLSSIKSAAQSCNASRTPPAKPRPSFSLQPLEFSLSRLTIPPRRYNQIVVALYPALWDSRGMKRTATNTEGLEWYANRSNRGRGKLTAESARLIGAGYLSFGRISRNEWILSITPAGRAVLSITSSKP